MANEFSFIPGERINGVVSHYDSERRFGFISPNVASAPDVFFLAREAGIRNIALGQSVSFVPVTNERGFKANGVKINEPILVVEEVSAGIFTLRFFDRLKGFGFLRPLDCKFDDDITHDVFVHISLIKKAKLSVLFDEPTKIEKGTQFKVSFGAKRQALRISLYEPETENGPRRPHTPRSKPRAPFVGAGHSD